MTIEKTLLGILPPGGLSRFKVFQPLLPFSREKFRQLVKAGLAPQPVRLGLRCTCWKNDDLIAFFSDPVSFMGATA